MINIEELTRRLGTFTAVAGIDPTAARDEVLGFIGPNGAGKSTTTKMATSHLSPSAGLITVGGYDVFEEPLSKGFKRFDGMAQAMPHEPTVLIKDKATNGLDPSRKHAVRELPRASSRSVKAIAYHYQFIAIVALVFALGSTHAGPNLGRLAIIGDSITQATGGSGAYAQNGNRSYRWHLAKQLVDAGATFNFVGSLANNYSTDSAYPSWRGVPFNPGNEGHWGWQAQEVLGSTVGESSGNRGVSGIVQWTDDALGGYTADTATIMIGINDLGYGQTDTQVSNHVAGIIDVLQADNPNVRIHLLELLHVGSGHSLYPALNHTVNDYNTNCLAPLAAAKTTSASTVTVVGMNNGFGFLANDMTYDNVHPNSRGEVFIANRIAAALGLTNEWTAVTVTNGNFEDGFTGEGTTNCKPNHWTLYGTPNPAAVPQQRTDYSIVAESTVDTVPTGTGSSGSSYFIAGAADTGIKQTLADTLVTNRHYMLQVSVSSGPSALTLNDWGIEVWAGATCVGMADNKTKPQLFTAGTDSQIGSKLTETTVEFNANNFPAAIGQPLEIRLFSKHDARYVGFEDVRLSWKPATAIASRHYKVFVFTGQSNCLGTDAGTEVNRLPGIDSADAQVPFWWHNISGDIYGISGSPGNSIGNSGGFWKTIRAQPGFNIYTNVANAWGPEIQFARTMYHAGETNVAVIKASCGGGGNSLWLKSNADNHMYVHVTNTVFQACTRLAAEGHTFEVAGLLYLQGESDNDGEQTAAGTRFKTLVDNLRTDLPNAAGLKGYMLGNLATAATRAAQEAIAAANSSYLFYNDILDLSDELVADNLHHNRKAKLVTGARFAQMVLGQAANFDPAAGHSAIYGQQYGSLAGGTTPLTSLTAVLSGNSPQLQGWSEEPALRDATATLATNQSAASLSPDPVGAIPAWNVTDNDATGAAYFYSRQFTATQTMNFANSGWVYSLNVRFPNGYAEPASFFLQYGDASSRWLVNVQRDLAGALTASFTSTNGETTATLQSAYDNAYHALVLYKAGGSATNSELVFDGAVLGQVSATAVDGALEPGVHFGTRSAVGKGSANVGWVNFSTAPATPGAGSLEPLPSHATATITEVPSDIVIVTTSDASVAETGDPGTFTFSRLNPASILTVNYSVNGTATAGSDYVALPGSVTFGVGETTTNVTLTPLDDPLYERVPETVMVTLAAGAGYVAGSPSNAIVTIASDETNPIKANNADALNLATSWLGDAPIGTETAVWNSTVTGANTVSLGANTTWGGLTIADPGGDVTLIGASAFTIHGPIIIGSNRNLTLGSGDDGQVRLDTATLSGSTTLTWNQTMDHYFTTYVGAFNSSNALNFNGVLRLRGSTPSTAPGSMQGATGRFWLHSSLGSQAPNTAFFLDTGSAPTNGQDFIIGDWNANGNRTLTLSGLTGFGTVRTDAGFTGTRNLIVNQEVNTTFNGMILSHRNVGGIDCSLRFTKDGAGSLTLAGIVGVQTAASSGSALLSLTVLNGTLVLAATNTLTGPTAVNGGALVVNGIHPTTSPITVAAAGTLSGTGVIHGAVTNNGTLAPGNDGIGTLTFGTNVNLAGTALMEISAEGGSTHDVVTSSFPLTYGGVLTVTNIGATALAVGHSFKLFNAPAYSGVFAATNLPPLNPGLSWSWISTNGTLAVVTTVNTTPTNLTASVSGSQLTLSWPADHIGWILQTQTNVLAVGLSTNWFDVVGSSATNQVEVTNDLLDSSVFFRLRLP